MKQPKYTFKVYEFHGPGMPMYANGVHFAQLLNDWATKCLKEDEDRDEEYKHHEARRIISFLHLAFEAGIKEQQRRTREVLDISSGHKNL